MAEPIYHLSILGAVLIAGLALRHARGDAERLAFLGTTAVYGFLLEKTVIALFGMHSYPVDRFPLHLWDVPVAVLLAWSVIMYSSLTTGRYLGLGRRRLPVFAGLFALHVDLSIETVAIRVPLWTWHLPGAWFDVPVVNFVGWYSVPLLFTWFFSYLRDRTGNCALAGLLSALVSTALLLVVVATWLRFVSPSAVAEVALFGAIVLASLVYLVRGWGRERGRGDVPPAPRLERFPAETFAAVLLIHLFYVQTILYYGYHRDSPTLLYVSAAMLFVGVGVHCLPRARGGASTRDRSEPVEPPSVR